MQKVKRLLVIGAERYGSRLMRGIHDFCQSQGTWEYHAERESGPNFVWRVKQVIREWKVDGIIAYVCDEAIEQLMLRSKVSVVNISGIYDIDLPTVKMDSAAIGRMAARHFLESGFQNFSFCAITAENYAIQRHQAFCDELAQSGFTCQAFTDRCVNHVEMEWTQNRRQMERWLLSLKKPVGMLCIYDQRAQEVVVASRRLGLRVPDDIAVVGVCNDESICQMCSPPLSSVDADIERIGYESAKLVNHMLEGGKPPSEAILIPPRRVITRASSNIIAIEDIEIADAMRFIRQHANEGISVSDVLRVVPISRRVMEQRFLKFVGRSPKAEIRRVRKSSKQYAREDESADWDSGGAAWVSQPG